MLISCLASITSTRYFACFASAVFRKSHIAQTKEPHAATFGVYLSVSAVCAECEPPTFLLIVWMHPIYMFFSFVFCMRIFVHEIKRALNLAAHILFTRFPLRFFFRRAPSHPAVN
jgi:hypothetical protein